MSGLGGDGDGPGDAVAQLGAVEFDSPAVEDVLMERLGLVERAWHLRQSGVFILKGRRGGVSRLRVYRGGLERSEQADRLARAVVHHDVQFMASTTTGPGDAAALGRAILIVWGTVLAPTDTILAEDQMVRLVAPPERATGLMSVEAIDRLSDRDCAVGALVRSGLCTSRDVLCLSKLGLVELARPASVMVPSLEPVADPWNHVPPELMATGDDVMVFPDPDPDPDVADREDSDPDPTG